MTVVNNPIRPGYYPDPSICAVGEDFYLVNSTFTYFPGVPIFHSKDLKNWRQIGNVLNRKSQISLDEQWHSGGIFAPSIRYHKGIFYMITTNVGGGGNFYVTATNPAGPWSEPYFLKDAQGIDPSLFFDEDGTAYYVGQRANSEGEKYWGDCEVWLQEIDLNEGKLLGESKVLWRGSMKHANWVEGPHLYKIGEYYYVMIAEGGTGFEHSITIARSKSLLGEYQSCPQNPIVTHRHFGRSYPITNTGHGDLVQDQNGEWYMVLLASRPKQGYCNMGRETFLAKVEWEDGWPVVNPMEGCITETVTVPLEERETIFEPSCYHFYEKEWEPQFIFLHNPDESAYERRTGEGVLRLYARKERMDDLVSSTYASIRQQHHCFRASTRMRPSIVESEEAGMALLQSNEYYITAFACKEDGQTYVKAEMRKKEERISLAKVLVEEGPIEFVFLGEEEQVTIRYRQNGQDMLLVEKEDITALSTEVAGGFVGCTIGMYITSNGKEGTGFADFHWLSYEGK
ncbi:glycoside hydrolase family 43 protein [Anaerosporobacter faecicola]|uniref:glycoside hydrolase family 43 protein n=1 Tax=Anaerosporobacter faecicola TaxID=2718714 RepID=UPI00143C03B9|nr:glycoside hydrolase family 43 protein [Anaerosporobacter faecicola]